jgi:biopolymer transport protein ExbD
MPLKVHQDELPALNLTPMIDIAFTLIIFFMVGARFTELERKVDLSVPAVGSTAALTPTPERRVINVYRDGRVELDRQPVSLSQLTAQLADAQRQYAELGVVIRGDAEGPFQHVASVLTACRQAGIAEMGISVRQGSDPTGGTQRR